MIGDDKFTACCPSHDDGSPSLTGKISGGKLLLKCWAGCATEDILSAMELDWESLFQGGSRRLRKPAVNRKRRAVVNLRRWRWAELRRLGDNLRLRDELARTVSEMVQAGQVSEE